MVGRNAYSPHVPMPAPYQPSTLAGRQPEPKRQIASLEVHRHGETTFQVHAAPQRRHTPCRHPAFIRQIDAQRPGRGRVLVLVDKRSAPPDGSSCRWHATRVGLARRGHTVDAIGLEAMERIMPASPPARRHHDCLCAVPRQRERGLTNRSGEPPPIWLAGKKTSTCQRCFQRLGRGSLSPLFALRARPAAPPKSRQVRRTYSEPLRSRLPACALSPQTDRKIRPLITPSGDGPFATASRMKC
jgi:hypothetical protein